MQISTDLHEKCPFYKKKVKQKEIDHFFFLVNFHMVFEDQIAISYQFLKSGSSKKIKIKKLKIKIKINKNKCPQFTRVEVFEVIVMFLSPVTDPRRPKTPNCKDSPTHYSDQFVGCIIYTCSDE